MTPIIGPTPKAPVPKIPLPKKPITKDPALQALFAKTAIKKSRNPFPLSYSLVISSILFLSLVVGGLSFNLVSGRNAKPTNVAQASNNPTETVVQNSDEITKDIKSLLDQRTLGSVTIKKVDEKNSSINIKLNETNETNHPAFLRVGQCSNPNDVINELKPIVKGVSENTVNKTIAEIQSQPTIILVHNSQADFNNYIACATLK